MAGAHQMMGSCPWRVVVLKKWLFPVGNDVAVLLGDGGESWGKVFSYGWVKVAYVKGDKCVERSLENPTNKLLRNYFWGKYFQFQKTLDWQRLPTNFDRKPSIRYKVHREGVCSPETQQQRGKRNIAFRDTVPALSVYFKRSFYEKMESYKNQPLLRQIFKEPPIISFKKGKSLKDMLVRAKIEKVNSKVSRRYGCAAYHPSHFLMFLFLPSPLFLFFCPRPYFLDELTRKRLLRRLDHTNQHCRNKRWLLLKPELLLFNRMNWALQEIPSTQNTNIYI